MTDDEGIKPWESKVTPWGATWAIKRWKALPWWQRMRIWIFGERG